MKRFVATFAMLALLASVSAEEVASPFKIALKRSDDRAIAKIEEGQATIVIRSPFGISGATVERVAEAWPERVTVRLHLKGLERFVARNGESAFLGAAMRSDPESSTRPSKKDLGSSPVDASEPRPLEVRSLDAQGEETERLLQSDGYFEIRLPEALFEKNPPSIEFGWIDFYRG